MKKFAHDIYAYLGFIVFYLVAYRDMLFEQSLFWALNLVPLPTANSRYYIPGQSYWFPGNLGSPAQPNIANWLPYLFVQLTGNNLVLAEKLLASATLVSCFTMYFFLSNHFKGSTIARFSASLIYGFGPATVFDFTDLTFWGYAAIPIVFNYMLNLLEGRRRVKDILILGLSLSFMIAFLPQILSLIFISILIFLAVYTLSLTEKLKYFRKVAFSFSIALLVLFATSPYLISGANQLMITIGWVQPSGVITSPSLPASPSQPTLYFTTYSNQEIANTIRLIGGAPGNHLPESSWIGFVLPILAFASLLLDRNGKKLLNLLSLTLVSIVTITIIYGIHLHTDWAMWLLYNTPISLFYYPERPLYVVTFAYAVMICVTMGSLLDKISTFFSGDHFTRTRLVSKRIWRIILSTLLVIFLLTSVFHFAPVFNVENHQERYHTLPPIYSSIQNWLTSHSGGEVYRIMFLPTDSFSVALGFSDTFEYTSGYTSRQTSRYVDFVYNQMIANGTNCLGRLLAPASVKYIILATPDSSTLWNGTLALRAPLHHVWDLSGPIRYTSEGVQGNPADIDKILSKQDDLELVYVAEDFRVYENLVYLPKISVFSNATYIVGSEDAQVILPNLPNFSTDNNMLIFANQNTDLAEELAEASSSLLFFNADINDYADLLSLSTEEHMAYEAAMDIVGLKRQLYLFSLNSSTFSKLVTIPSGQWRVALSVPEPVMVNKSMDIISLNQGQIFLTKENFKPACNLPLYDFDLANYYFYTATGGSYTMKVAGSGDLWAYVAYNFTTSNIAEVSFNHLELPDNGTFTIDLPPSTIFQPIVNAYNPSLGHNVANNIDEITIEYEISGEYSKLAVDGANICRTQVSSANGWYVFGPLTLNSGTHNLTISNGVPEYLVAVYNTPNLSQIFTDNESVDYNFSALSETSYKIKVNADSPVFLSLSESYFPNWVAYSGTQTLSHFTAFSYSNGFYLNGTDNADVAISYTPPLLNQVYVAQQILFAIVGLLILVLAITPTLLSKIRNRKGNYETKK